MQVAVGMVVTIRLVVSGISQPPSATVGCLPRTLLSSGTLHSALRAATTTFGGTSHVNNEVRLLRVVVGGLLHSVVHDGPVVLVARRPDLHAGWTGMFVATSADGVPVIDSYNSASRVAGCRDS